MHQDTIKGDEREREREREKIKLSPLGQLKGDRARFENERERLLLGGDVYLNVYLMGCPNNTSL